MVTTVDYFEGVAEVCRAEATFSQVYKSSMRNLAQFSRYRQEWPTASVGLDRLLHLFCGFTRASSSYHDARLSICQRFVI